MKGLKFQHLALPSKGSSYTWVYSACLQRLESYVQDNAVMLCCNWQILQNGYMLQVHGWLGSSRQRAWQCRWLPKQHVVTRAIRHDWDGIHARSVSAVAHAIDYATLSLLVYQRQMILYFTKVDMYKSTLHIGTSKQPVSITRSNDVHVNIYFAFPISQDPCKQVNALCWHIKTSNHCCLLVIALRLLLSCPQTVLLQDHCPVCALCNWFSS